MFQQLSFNFSWWANRKDPHGRNLFEGGFLGLDNIGVFDRSSPLPTGGYMEQADGTAWMALFCQNLFEMALELADADRSVEDLAVKFAQHFFWIAGSMDRPGDNDDELFDEAARLVVAERMASASFLQRRMRIGFSRASRLIDMMEREGVAFAVKSAHIEYLRPARLDDALEVRTGLVEVAGASLKVRQRVWRKPAAASGELLADMMIRLAVMNRAGKPMRLPADIRAALAPHADPAREM